MDTKALLIILDGFGHSEDHAHNAIYPLAKKPYLDHLLSTCPHSLIETSGHSVGLPAGVMGNSEVGHLNIGGGRIIKQELTKIADFAKEKGFESLDDVHRVMTSPEGDLHLMGLLSDGGVHSHQEHLFLLLEACARLKVKKKVFIHVITDGRDTPPQSALQFAADLEKAIAKNKVGIIATVSGRYYIMDRDKRWERTELAYKNLIEKSPQPASSLAQAIEDAYKNNETDEFIKPRQIQGGGLMRPQDAVIFFNFRADRARQISRALCLNDFKEFPTPVKLDPKNYVTFTRYEDSFLFPVLFKPAKYTKILGELVAAKNEKQLRIAETEKYAHVTYFFNGGEEPPFKGEERILVQSPKEVATYDLKPEMSAPKVTEELEKKLNSESYRLIVLNFANSDMVGHTGNEPAAIRAVEVLDQCLKRVCEKAHTQGYDILITADHGNSECMVDPITGAPHTAHTTNPVPLIWFQSAKSKEKFSKIKLQNGILADIAPTILKIYGWDQPAEMSGKALF